MDSGSLAARTRFIEVTKLEGRLGDEARFFAAFLGLLPESAPPTDDPAWMSLRAAVRREIGLVPELVHLLGDTGPDEAL